MIDRLEALRNAPIFRNVKPETLKSLDAIAGTVKFKEDEIIIREGDAGSCMYILMSGKVRITKNITLRSSDNDAGAIEKDLITLSSENNPVFGEMSLLEEDVRTATVTALTEVELLKIERENFQDLAKRDYESGYHVALEIARIISSRLRKTDRDVVKLTTVLGIALSRDRSM